MAYNDTHRAPREYSPKDDKVLACEMGVTKIYKGDIVRIDIGTGYAFSTTDPAHATTGDSIIAGVALETVDNNTTNATAGDKTIRVLTEGVVPLLETGGTATRANMATFAVLGLTGNQQTVTSAAAEAATALTVGMLIDVHRDDAGTIGGTASGTLDDVYLQTLKTPLTS